MCDNKQFKFLDHKLKESNHILIAFVLNDCCIIIQQLQKGWAGIVINVIQ